MAAKHCKKLSLELGGKNANIVFNDADLDVAVATSVRSSFLNQVHTSFVSLLPHASLLLSNAGLISLENLS